MTDWITEGKIAVVQIADSVFVTPEDNWKKWLCDEDYDYSKTMGLPVCLNTYKEIKQYLMHNLDILDENIVNYTNM